MAATNVDTATARALSASLQKAQVTARKTYSAAVAAAKLARDEALATAYAEFTKGLELAQGGETEAAESSQPEGAEGTSTEDESGDGETGGTSPAPISGRRRNAA
jgi:hypothetical protein